MSLAKSKIRFASRVADIRTSPTAVVLNRVQDLRAQGVDIIDFGPGEPDFRTPDIVSEAGKRAIDEGHTKYTNSFGTAEIRVAIAEKYNRCWGSHLAARNVIAGSGGKQELFNLMLALVSAGDEVVIPSPYWASFPDLVAFAQGTPVFAATDPANHFRPTLDVIRHATTAKTRGVILNSPSNPTGAVIDPKELEKIIGFCDANGLFFAFDETYEFFVYDGNQHVSAIHWYDEFPETVIAVNSMSKTFAMTGWRLGYAVAHPEIIAALGRIQSHSTSNPSSIAQVAALTALDSGAESVRKMYEAYRERRDWLVPALNAIPGFECAAPDGAFYVFPRVSALYGHNGINGSQSLADFLLEEAHVALVPGIAFGADEFVRISYATSMAMIEEGTKRIRKAIGKLAG